MVVLAVVLLLWEPPFFFYYFEFFFYNNNNIFFIWFLVYTVVCYLNRTMPHPPHRRPLVFLLSVLFSCSVIMYQNPKSSNG